MAPPTTTKDAASRITKIHERIIDSVCASNPTADLQQIADHLNGMPEMSSCNLLFTPAVLDELGYEANPPAALASPTEESGGNGEVLIEPQIEHSEPVTIGSIAKTLEERHVGYSRLLKNMLARSTHDRGSMDVIVKLETADSKCREELISLKDRESPQLIPEAIIIFCLLSKGVRSEDIKIIENL